VIDNVNVGEYEGPLTSPSKEEDEPCLNLMKGGVKGFELNSGRRSEGK